MKLARIEFQFAPFCIARRCVAVLSSLMLRQTIGNLL